MKKIFGILVAVFATFFSSLAGPLGVQSNAKDGLVESLPRHIAASSPILASSAGEMMQTGRPIVASFWVEGPTKSNSSFEEFAGGIVRGLVAGRFPTNSSTEFRLIAEQLTTSMERIPWQVTMVFPNKAGEKIAMAGLVTEATCPQDANLNEVQVFSQAAYSPTAIGVLNGGLVIAGPATLEVEYFIVLVATKSYTAPYDEVRQWMEIDNKQFSITMKTSIGGVSVLSTISSEGYGVFYPRLAIERISSHEANLWHPLGNPARSYLLIGSETLDFSWTDLIGNITGDEAMTLHTTGAPNMLFRSLGM